MPPPSATALPTSATPVRDRKVLDGELAELGTRSDRPWGLVPVVGPLAALILLITAGTFAASALRGHHHSLSIGAAVLLNVVIDGGLAVAVWRAGARVAAANGGWGPAFGLRWPRRADLKYAAVGIVAAFALRAVVSAIANGLSHGTADNESQNIHLHSVNPASVALLVVVTVVSAPLIEEVLFRGLLLRTFMRRLKFWPAAVLSTLIFAALHTYEVSTLTGALTLAGSVSCLGIVNCYLNRRTARLAPGMMVHATFNLVAVIAVVAQAKS